MPKWLHQVLGIPSAQTEVVKEENPSEVGDVLPLDDPFGEETLPMVLVVLWRMMNKARPMSLWKIKSSQMLVALYHHLYISGLRTYKHKYLDGTLTGLAHVPHDKTSSM